MEPSSERVGNPSVLTPASRVHAGAPGADVYGSTNWVDTAVAGSANVAIWVPKMLCIEPVVYDAKSNRGICSSSTYTRTGVPDATPNELVRSTSRFVLLNAFARGVTVGVVGLVTDGDGVGVTFGVSVKAGVLEPETPVVRVLVIVEVFVAAAEVVLVTVGVRVPVGEVDVDAVALAVADTDADVEGVVVLSTVEVGEGRTDLVTDTANTAAWGMRRTERTRQPAGINGSNESSPLDIEDERNNGVLYKKKGIEVKV